MWFTTVAGGRREMSRLCDGGQVSNTLAACWLVSSFLFLNKGESESLLLFGKRSSATFGVAPDIRWDIINR